MRDRLAAVTDAEALYNVKIKKYGELWRVSCWDTHIFNPDKVEFFIYPEPTRPEREPMQEFEKVMRDMGWIPPRPDSLQRAKNKVYDIAYMNEWSHFVTLTLDDCKADRYDPLALKKALHTFLGNRVQRDGLRYLGVPEYHKDKALHCHFLVAAETLRLADSGTVMVTERDKPVKRETAKRAGYTILKTVYNWTDWELGWSTAIPVDSNAPALAGYMAKYITKQTAHIFGKRYLAGGAIKREVPTIYRRWDYDSIDAKEYNPAPGRRVKYLTLEGME